MESFVKDIFEGMYRKMSDENSNEICVENHGGISKIIH